MEVSMLRPDQKKEGRKFKKLLYDLQITQEDFAILVDKTTRCISYYTTGDRGISKVSVESHQQACRHYTEVSDHAKTYALLRDVMRELAEKKVALPPELRMRWGLIEEKNRE